MFFLQGAIFWKILRLIPIAENPIAKNTLNTALKMSMCNAPFDVIQHNRIKYSQLDIREITDCGDDGDGIEERVGEGPLGVGVVALSVPPP